jgi:RHS repeat-associated protein
VVETNAIGEEITGTRTLYEPYGTPLTTPRDGAPSYTGHPYDTGTGLIYAQQRYYDPLLGVFLSPDPMAVDTTSAFNFNRYAYANNSPYKFTDPDGRFAEFLWGAVIGAGVEVFVQTAVQGKSFSDIDLSDVAVAAGAGALTGGIASGAALAAARGSVSVGAAVAQTAVGSGAVAVNASLASDVFNGEAPDAQAALVDGATAAVTALPVNLETMSDPVDPANVLAHELVGHAIPHAVGGGSGNAVKEDNIVREQNGDPPRPAEPDHCSTCEHMP